MVALTADDLTGTRRASVPKRDDGSWGPWYDAEALDGEGPENPGGPRGTQPVFVGRTNTVQIAIRRPTPPPPAPPATAKPDLGYLPVSVEQPVRSERQRRADHPAPGARRHVRAADRSRTPGPATDIISRAQWGADESLRAVGRGTTTGFAPEWCTTPRAATTTHRRTRR